MSKIEENKNGSLTFICDCGNVYNIRYNKETEKVETEAISVKEKKKEIKRKGLFSFGEDEGETNE